MNHSDHDLSAFALQQSHAKPMTGEELEVFGKKAAMRFQSGECSRLNEAVVETIKHAGLGPEQVRRVVEFTNLSAYQSEFQKEGSHKYVSFQGGPADPSEVLKDLNDGGGGTVFDRGILDYFKPPSEKTAAVVFAQNRAKLGLEKTASIAPTRAEQAFHDMWQSEDRPLPYADPCHDTVIMREKLAGVRAELTTRLSELEVDYVTISDSLYQEVKQASLEGVPLGHVVQAWADVTPGEGYVKAAFALIGPRLVEEGVLPSLDALGADLEKTAGQVLVNQAHPIVHGFVAFCTTLDKLAETRTQREEVTDAYTRIDWFTRAAVKQAGAISGAIDVAKKGFGRAAELSGKAGEHVAKEVGEHSPLAGKALGGLVKYSPHIAAGVAGKELYDRQVAHGPLGKPVRYAASLVPGTEPYNERQYMLANRGYIYNQ